MLNEQQRRKNCGAQMRMYSGPSAIELVLLQHATNQ